jgi:DnaK suppressor protein
MSARTAKRKSSKVASKASKKSPVKKKTVAKQTAKAKKKSSAKKKTVAKKTKPKAKVAKKAKAKVTKKATSKPTKKAKATVKPAKPLAKKKVAKAPSKKAKRVVSTAEARKARAAHRRKMAGFRKLLLKKHEELLEAYASSKGNTRAVDRDGTEYYIDYAVSSYDRDFTLSLTEMERKRLASVEDALKRIARSEFGRCMQCSQEIPEPRLQVEPWARYCIRCQELDDQGLLQQLELEPEDEDGRPTAPSSETEAEGEEADDELDGATEDGGEIEEDGEESESSGDEDDLRAI